MGGQVDIGVGTDTASVSGSSLSRLARLVKLVADLAMNPKFPASELERRKGDNLRRLSIAKSISADGGGEIPGGHLRQASLLP